MERTLVNDIHSRLNPTWVSKIIAPTSLDALQREIVQVKQTGETISVAGGRHCMGGQQFGTDTRLLDMPRLNQVLNFDPEAGTVEVEAGIQWPALIDFLEQAQAGQAQPWAIAQKQTGANALTIGGAIAANVHGRGLCMGPFVTDLEALTLVDAEGELRVCDRHKNAELFGLAVGGYGLFGIVYSATLRLVPRRKLQRMVEMTTVDDLMAAFAKRVADGFLYGDFQYATDAASPDFLHRGVFSCYRAVDAATSFASNHKHLTPQDWQRLAFLAHTDKSRAFEVYAAHYLSTSGQIYWSDRHQEAVYLDDYHQNLNAESAPASEVITEIFVPRDRLADFLAEVRHDFRAYGVNLIYGTIRLIERDPDTFLAWAREAYACVIFNLHTEHTPEGGRAFRAGIPAAH